MVGSSSIINTEVIMMKSSQKEPPSFSVLLYRQF